MKKIFHSFFLIAICCLICNMSGLKAMAEDTEQFSGVNISISPKIFLKSNNIVERANYLYNITWDCKTDVDGWRQYAENHYSQGNSYHIPYGQPVDDGKYVYYGIPISDFLTGTTDPAGDFYLKRSVYYDLDPNGNIINDPHNKNSVYYAIDCSAFASYCWDL